MPRRRQAGASRGREAPTDAAGVLIRCQVGSGHWAEDIPPVPLDCDVSVSFACETAADEHRDALALLGYRIVDLPPEVTVEKGTADFLVSGHLVERHPTYWRSLAAHGVRAYHLSLGPAAAAVADVVIAHLRTPGLPPVPRKQVSARPTPGRRG